MFPWIKLNTKDLEDNILLEEKDIYNKKITLLYHGINSLKEYYFKIIKQNHLQILHKNIYAVNMTHRFHHGKLKVVITMNLKSEIITNNKFELNLSFDEATRLKEHHFFELKYGLLNINIENRINLNYDEHVILLSIIEELKLYEKRYISY